MRLKDVDFGYNPDKIVLHDVSLYAEPGQKVAFVGATGAGKTTITNLINRFYDIADGKIRYDGININKIKKADLRRSLGIILQDTVLFTGTVMENIRYGKLDATDEECIGAARLAGAHDFITRLPEGYQTVIDGNGIESVPGTETADFDCACCSCRSAGYDYGRGDIFDRYQNRGDCAERYGCADARTNRIRYRTQTVHSSEFRCDHGSRAWTDYRARQP